MIIKGDLIYSKTKNELDVIENGYLVIENGKIKSVFKELKENKTNKDEKFLDYSGKLIIPPFIDMHLHAPQYANSGLGTDVELLTWLEKYTYPEEIKFKDKEYRESIFKDLINKLWSVGSMYSVIFGSLYKDATEDLIKLLIKSGLGAYVGKVNMDINSPDFYRETLKESIDGTEELLKKYGNSELVKPIITPRFVPHCSSESMAQQGKLAKKYNAPVQSHLNESLSEIEWVRELHKKEPNYSKVYDKFGLFGKYGKVIMAHVIFNKKEEIKMMKQKNFYAVHCPESNANLISGIMDVRELLNNKINVCLGSDLSGGHNLFMPNQIVLAIQLSKMKSRIENNLKNILTFSECFYMATKSGGPFFGKIGSFEKDFDANFLVIDTKNILASKEKRSPIDRLQKFIYIGSSNEIIERYIKGKKILKPFN